MSIMAVRTFPITRLSLKSLGRQVVFYKKVLNVKGSLDCAKQPDFNCSLVQTVARKLFALTVVSKSEDILANNVNKWIHKLPYTNWLHTVMYFCVDLCRTLDWYFNSVAT